MLAMLPTNLHDPEKRLEIAHAATQIAKAQQAAIPQGLVDQISDFAVPALTARAARVVFATGLLHRLPPFNVTISNVPGPNVPVYLCGAKLLAHYPVSVITDGQGLNITLVGYLGRLHFGLTRLPRTRPRHRHARQLPGRRAGTAGQGRRPAPGRSRAQGQVSPAIHPRIAGSTDTCETATTNCAGRAGTGSLVIVQSEAVGSPDGRAASRTCLFTGSLRQSAALFAGR